MSNSVGQGTDQGNIHVSCNLTLTPIPPVSNGMSDQGRLCERVHCSIKFNSQEVQLWVAEEKLVCDFVNQVLTEIVREPGSFQFVWICEPENKILYDDMIESFKDIGIRNCSEQHFLVSPVPDDSESPSEFTTADDELSLGASASPTNLSSIPSPLAPRMSLDLSKRGIMLAETAAEFESEPASEFISGEDELGLGASASPTSNSSVPTPPPRPPSPPSSLLPDKSAETQESEVARKGSTGIDGKGTLSRYSSRRTGYVGLVNQAMTCYLNSLLQALYMTPEFRNALYCWEFDGGSSKRSETKSIPYQLQKLFLNLQTSSKSAVETTELTQSFGWDSSEAWQQHDIQELCRVMFDALEHKFEGTEQANLINKLYQGKMIDYVKCLECGKEKQREDTFLDIPLPIRPFGATSAYSSIEEALRGFVKPETLDGNNQYFCEGCGKKCDAHKGLKFTHFPYLLTFHLMRFDFDYKTMHRIKLNDRVTFPEILNLDHFFEDNSTNEKETSAGGEKNDDNSTADSGSALDDDSCLPSVDSTLPTPSQEMDQDSDEGIEVGCASNGGTKDVQGRYVYELFSIMIHSGSASGGHYYAYIKDFATQKWFCFNDQSVSSLMPEDIEKTFGGGSTSAYYSGAYSSSTNAYMLMYRQIDKENNAFAMTVDEFPPHLKKLYEKLEEKERLDPYVSSYGDVRGKKWDIVPSTGRKDYQKDYSIYNMRSPEEKETPPTEESQNAKKWSDLEARQMKARMHRSQSSQMKLIFYYPKSNVVFSNSNPYASNMWRADFSYEFSAPFSKLIDDVYETLKNEDPSVERSQVSVYVCENPHQKNEDKISRLLEGKEDESIGDVFARIVPSRTLHHITARTSQSEINALLCPSESEKLAIHRVDIIEEEINKSRRHVYCKPYLTVKEFKCGLRAEFNIPEHVRVIIAVETHNRKFRDTDRRSLSLNLKPTELKFLVNENATLKEEDVTSATPTYVCFLVTAVPEREAMERIFKIVDSDKNSVTVKFTLPDVDPHILERLSIPSLKDEKPQETTANQKENKTCEEIPTVREHSKSNDLRIYTDRDSFVSSKVDTCPVTINGSNCGDVGGGVVDPGGHSTGTCSGDGPSVKPFCSVPVLENIEEEQVHFSDQSASEESSLTDSERTIIGDVPDDCPMSSASNSPDASFQLSQDLMSNSLSNIMDIPPVNCQSAENKEDWNDNQSIVLSSSDFPSVTFRCKEVSGKTRSGSKQLSVDKRMPFKTLLESLEPYVGVSAKYFKIYSCHKNYEIRDEYDFVRYYQTENSFVIKLEPHLKHGEFRVKVYHLPEVVLPNVEMMFLFEWIIRKGETVAETKEAMLKEFFRMKGFEIPPEKCRLRKKTTELGRICLDNEIWDEDITLMKKSESLLLQELSGHEVKTNPDQMVVYVRRWDSAKQAQGEVREIVLEENATRTTLIEEISKVSGIPPEHIDVTRSPFTFPEMLSVYKCTEDKFSESSVVGEPQWGDPEENLKDSSLRIGGDGPVLLYIDKREEGSDAPSFNAASKEVSVPSRSTRAPWFENNQEQEDDVLKNLNRQKVNRRNTARKERGLIIHLGSSPVDSPSNFSKYSQDCSSSGEMEE